LIRNHLCEAVNEETKSLVVKQEGIIQTMKIILLIMKIYLILKLKLAHSSMGM
jgi:hypothetical protein